MRARLSALVTALAILASGVAHAGAAPPLAQSPTLSRTQIVFTWGDFLWSVPREGGVAKRLTSTGHEGAAAFSPDGRWIAYSSEVDGNRDIYVIPAEGGEPRRLTFHPGVDQVVGWTPDGKKVLFSSTRDSYALFVRLYTVPLEGGWQEPLPMWRGEAGAYSRDASRIAYVPNSKWQPEWKRYRGGQATPIWLARLDNLQVEKIPRDRSNDSHPVWVGDTVYFLSDRDGPVSLYAYDTKSKAVRRVLDNRGLDFKSLSAGPDALVYEQFGSIHLYSPADGTTREVRIRIEGEPEAVQPKTISAASEVENVVLSPNGDAVAVEAHGDILTVGTGGKGARDLTLTPGVHERDPAWSPDGQFLAYLSDESGEYALHIRSRSDPASVRKIAVGDRPTFLDTPQWSPDGRNILLGDAWSNLWRVDLETGRSVKIDHAAASAVWSPDSRWIAYTKPMASTLRAVWLQSVETGKSVRVSDPLADSRWPVFDKGGRLLMFAVSTDLGLSMTIQDMSGMNHPISRTVWAAVLRKDDAAALSGPDSSGAEPQTFRIDTEGLDNRLAPLPIPAGNYSGLQGGAAGVLFLEELPVIQPRTGGRNGEVVSRYDLRSSKLERVGARVNSVEIAKDGERALYRIGRSWFTGPATGPFEPGAGGALDFGELQIQTDPRAEWREMFREAWRYERDFFYDPGLHGLDLAKVRKTYAPFVEAAGGRNDILYLFREMLGDLTIGHMAVGSSVGFRPANGRRGGLLGADFRIENGRYRIARIYDGGRSNPDVRAPLARIGLDVRAGDYLLAVNGHPLSGQMDIYSLLEDTPGKPTRLSVAADPQGTVVREITVIPVSDEFDLRVRAWSEDNRRKVDALSGGRIAYVRVPDTADAGFTSFNRFYFAQVGKEAAIVDARFNTGGRFADYIVDLLRRPLRNCAITRADGGYCVPGAQIYGPKTMITNEMSGSGGDALPWMFKQDRTGALVGTRTWGGLVGGGGPSLLDGTGLATPFHAHYGLKGEWEVENVGVTPDYEVENDPASMAAGHDLQLEKAVEVTLEALRKTPVTTPTVPPFPRYDRP